MVGLTGRKEELLPWLSASAHSPLFATIVAAEAIKRKAEELHFSLRLCLSANSLGFL